MCTATSPCLSTALSRRGACHSRSGSSGEWYSRSRRPARGSRCCGGCGADGGVGGAVALSCSRFRGPAPSARRVIGSGASGAARADLEDLALEERLAARAEEQRVGAEQGVESPLPGELREHALAGGGADCLEVAIVERDDRLRHAEGGVWLGEHADPLVHELREGAGPRR